MYLGENLLKRNTYHSISHLKFEDSEPEKQVEMGYEKEQDGVKIDFGHESVEMI